jgi:competence protein ComEC
VSAQWGWLATPLAPLALALAAGIALAPVTPARTAWCAWGLGIVGAAMLARRARDGPATVVLLLAVAALGALHATAPPLPRDHVARLELPTTALVEGRLAAEPIRWASDRTRLLIDTDRVDGLSRTGRIQATLYGESPALTSSQRLAVELRLREASGFRNPGVFDYAAHLAREGVHVLASGRADRVVPLDQPLPSWPLRIRRRALEILRDVLPPTSAALLGGLLLGDRSALPHDVNDAFRRAGVYHVLAVSGFNVGLVASTVFALLLAARAGRRTAAATAMVAVVAFAFVVGPQPSVLRATLMGVLVLGAILLEREASVLNSLSLAALVVLTLRPGDLLDPGFQLSFAATGGIVLAPLPRGVVRSALGVSTAAQLAVLPVTLTHFNQVSTVGVIANLAIVPLAALATVVGLGGIALGAALESAGGLLLNAAWPVLIALRAVVLVAASVPAAVVHLPAPHWTAVVAYAGALGLALTAWRRRTRPVGRARALAILASILLILAAVIEAWPLLRATDGQLRITVLDVGQGDAIVVETPDGRAVLIDAGAGGPHRLDVGERVVAPFLWNRGHLALAAAVVTHTDLDHAGGMAAIRRLFRVAEPGTIDAMVAGSRRAGVAVAALGGPSLVAEGEIGWSRNDTALVLRFEFGQTTFLLASDITARTEGELLRHGAGLAATVLKVAHHGARGSTTAEFLRAVHPAVAVISVGRRNPYGHPSPEIIARLRESGATIYRTDHDGAVMLETDGRSLTVTTWASRRRDRYCLDPETIC